MKIKNEYIINSETCLLYYNLNKVTKVDELNNNYYINQGTTEIVNKSCHYFGSSLVERQNMTKRLIKVSVKSPILLVDTKNIIFFPTRSPREKNCIWISYNNLVKYTKENSDKTRLVFKNKKEIVINTSYNIIDNQITRCMKLEKEINKRIKSL